MSNTNFESVDQTSNISITATGLNTSKAYRLYLRQGDILSVLNPNVTLYDDGPYTSKYAKLPAGHNGSFTISFTAKPAIYDRGATPPSQTLGSYLIGWVSNSTTAYAPMVSEETDPAIALASNSINPGWFGAKALIVVPGVPNAPTNLGASFYSSAFFNGNYFQFPQVDQPSEIGGIFIEKSITIDRDVIMDGIFGSTSGNVNVDANATITVTSGYTFSLGKTAFTSGSTNTWGGIIVNNGATLTTNYPTGYIDKTYIDHATTAIEARNNSNVFVANTEFRSNYIGINFDGNPGEAFELQVQGSRFYRGIVMKPSVVQTIDQPGDYFELAQPYAGIRICNNNNYFSDFCGGNASCLNQFYNMENGIILKNSSGDFSSCKFRDIKHLYSVNNVFKGSAITAKSTNIYEANSLFYNGLNNAQTPDFKDCDNGVMTYNYSVNLRNAQIDNMKTVGVEVSDCFLKQCTIQNNVVKAGIAGVRMFGNFWSGIDVVDNYINVFSGIQGASACVDMANNDNLNLGLPSSQGGITIRNNYINNYAQGQGVRSVMDIFPVVKDNFFTTNDMQFGDGLRFEGGSLGYAMCNSFSQPVLGTAGQEASALRTFLNPMSFLTCNSEVKYPRGLTFLGTSTGSIIKGNSINQNRFGMLYEFDAITGLQPDLTLPAATLNGNNWNGYSFGDWGARHNGTTSNIVVASSFTVNPAIFPTHTTTISVTNSSFPWFVNNSQFQTFSCQDLAAPLNCGNNGPLTPTVIPTQPDSADVRMVMDSLDSPLYPNSYRWIAKKQLYAKLLRWPAMINSKAVFTPFYNNNANTTIGHFSTLDRNINRVGMLPGFSQVQYRAQLTSLDSLENLLRIAVGQPSPNQQVINQLENAVQLSRNNLAIANANNMVLRNARLTNLDAINAAISTSAVYEQNEKTVNDAKISYLQLANIALDSITMVNLIAIANQCPIKGGEAVFGARYLVNRKLNLRWDDYDLCQVNLPRSNEAASSTNSNLAGISPNPFINELRVNFEGNEMKELRIYDLKGLQVHRSMVLSGQQVDVSQLVPGIYIGELSSNGKERIQLKLVKF